MEGQEMTDQFSQEYISFILSDEAKALQEKPERGQWVWCRHLGVVTLVTGVGCDGSQTTEGYLYDAETTLLPTLHDLLRVIEGVGWKWSRKPSRWDAWIPTVVPLTAKEWAMIENTEDMLAAAKLAVRALTNHK